MIQCFFNYYLLRNEKSKGIAYIEYENEKSATAAIMKLDQTEFKNSWNVFCRLQTQRRPQTPTYTRHQEEVVRPKAEHQRADQ
jgi:RNA recognition motif-containing protein